MKTSLNVKEDNDFPELNQQVSFLDLPKTDNLTKEEKKQVNEEEKSKDPHEINQTKGNEENKSKLKNSENSENFENSENSENKNQQNEKDAKQDKESNNTLTVPEAKNQVNNDIRNEQNDNSINQQE